MISYLSEKTRGLSATWSAGRNKKSFEFSTLLVNINVIFLRHDMLRSPTISADTHTSVNVKNSSSAFINSYQQLNRYHQQLSVYCPFCPPALRDVDVISAHGPLLIHRYDERFNLGLLGFGDRNRITNVADLLSSSMEEATKASPTLLIICSYAQELEGNEPWTV